MPRMPLGSLRKFKVILPPMDLQKKFVSIANQADKSEFDEFKSQFIEMFGNPLTNDKNWAKYVLLKDASDIVLGSTPNSKEPSYWDGNCLWITPAEMSEESFYISDTTRHITEKGRNAANLTIMPVGTVLFSTRAPIGKIGIVSKPMCCNQGFKNFIPGDDLNSVFLYYTLIYNRTYLQSLGIGTTFKELSKKAIESLSIAIPSMELQNKFEMILNQADKSEFELRKSIATIDNVIKSLINNQ